MPNMGVGEWAIVLGIVVLLFGVGRLSKIGRELGEGIREFRQGLAGEEDESGERGEEEA